jgi:hypothetical protein
MSLQTSDLRRAAMKGVRKVVNVGVTRIEARSNPAFFCRGQLPRLPLRVSSLHGYLHSKDWFSQALLLTLHAPQHGRRNLSPEHRVRIFF